MAVRPNRDYPDIIHVMYKTLHELHTPLERETVLYALGKLGHVTPVLYEQYVKRAGVTEDILHLDGVRPLRFGGSGALQMTR